MVGRNQKAVRWLGFWLLITMLIGLNGIAQAETDVSAKVQVVKGTLAYDRLNKQSYLNVSVKNTSTDVLLTPIKVMIDSVAPSTITVANADGKTGDGKAYLIFTTENGQFLPGASIAAKKLSFANPTAARFSYTTKVLGIVPDAERLVGPTGGVVELSDSQAPNKKVVIEIPPGALPADSHITISDDTNSDRNPPQGYESIGQRIKLTTTSTLTRFVKVRLPLTSNISEGDLVFVSHYDDKTGQFTIIPVDFIDFTLGYIEFTMPSFCTVEPVKISGLPLSDQINMNIFFSSIYPFLMNMVQDYEANINTYSAEEEKITAYMDLRILLATKTVDAYAVSNTLVSPGEFASMAVNQVSDFVVTALDSNDPNKDWIDPTMQLLLCTFQGAAEASLTKQDPRVTIAKACAVESIKQTFYASVRFNEALKIYGEIRRINEAWITIDYMKLFYSNGGDYNKMAAALINKVPATEDAIINEVARYSYKDGLFSWNDYDVARVKTLVGKVKSAVAKTRSDNDPDNDLIPNKFDLCPGTLAGQSVNADGCAAIQLDADGDGVLKTGDLCPNTPAGQQPDANGCSFTQLAPDPQHPDFTSPLLDPSPMTLQWKPIVHPDGLTVKYCVVVKNRNDVNTPNDDIPVFDTCKSTRPEYQLISGTSFDLPASTLAHDVNYTWTVFGVVNNGATNSDWSKTIWEIFSTTAAPVIVSTGELLVARANHTATLLQNGKVLIAGGNDTITALSSAELYDPSTGEFSSTGSMGLARGGHTATLLTNGKVLIAGGYVNSAELYDPTTGKFTPTTNNMSVPRGYHSATLLQNGKVLVVGGNYYSSFYKSAEVYDPATDQFTPVGSMSGQRRMHTATLLANGNVLIAGGDGNGYSLPSAEIFNITTNTFYVTGSLGTARHKPTETLLPNGKVLIAGGVNGSTSLTSVELYDPATGKFVVAGNFTNARHFHTATLIPGGILFTGGVTTYGSLYQKSMELFSDSTGVLSPAGDMARNHYNHTATLLPNGSVLIAGGYYFANAKDNVQKAAELYTPEASNDRINHIVTMALNTQIGQELNDYIEYFRSNNLFNLLPLTGIMGNTIAGWLEKDPTVLANSLNCDFTGIGIDLDSRIENDIELTGILIHEITHYRDAVVASQYPPFTLNAGETEIRAYANMYVYLLEAFSSGSYTIERYNQSDYAFRSALKTCWEYINGIATKDEALNSLLAQHYTQDYLDSSVSFICGVTP